MKKQNPRRGNGTGCKFHRADDAKQLTNETAKRQDASRYAGLTLSLFMAAKPAGVQQ